MNGEKDLSYYSTNVVAHNAALYPEKLERAIKSHIPHIEVDLSLVDGGLVVAHGPEEYQALTAQQRKLQNPDHVFGKIFDAGKHVYLDLKDNMRDFRIADALPPIISKDDDAIATSNNHDDLLELKRKGFAGKILFSIENPNALAIFLEENHNKKFGYNEFGLSIRYSILTAGVSKRLKDMGFLIATWNPLTRPEIESCLKLDAEYITSDSFTLLESISTPQSPSQNQ